MSGIVSTRGPHPEIAALLRRLLAIEPGAVPDGVTQRASAVLAGPMNLQWRYLFVFDRQIQWGATNPDSETERAQDQQRRDVFQAAYEFQQRHPYCPWGPQPFGVPSDTVSSGFTELARIARRVAELDAERRELVAQRDPLIRELADSGEIDAQARLVNAAGVSKQMLSRIIAAS